MSPVEFLLMAVAGGVGAVARFMLDGFLRPRVTSSFQWTTTIINATGSLLLGFLTGLTNEHLLSSDLSFILCAGFCGGYTTFSTASYETVQLVQKGRHGQALMSGLGMLVICLALAALGLWAGDAI